MRVAFFKGAVVSGVLLPTFDCRFEASDSPAFNRQSKIENRQFHGPAITPLVICFAVMTPDFLSVFTRT